MTDTTVTNLTSAAGPVPIVTPDRGHNRVGQLLAGLQELSESACQSATAADAARYENHLALVRLGMATSLFYALRTKHPPTAAHCLRVAILCSAWAQRMGLDESQRDRIEVAALLHDLGKIGIPDRILRKPGKLSVDEQLTMDGCPAVGCEILRGCTQDPELLDIVLHASTWYDSRRHDDHPGGEALPLGSRMLAIADAFDAMTTDSVYRPALSRERAINELLQGSCTQFDPELAIDFHRMLEMRPEMLQSVVVDRWLRQLQPRDSVGMWAAAIETPMPGAQTVRRETLFHQRLLSQLKDGIAFTDGEGNVTQWNTTLRQLTSIAPDAMIGHTWSEQTLRLRDANASDDSDASGCLVQQCLRSGVMVSRRMVIEQPGQDATPVQVQVLPVTGACPGVHGTVVIVRDLSLQKSMQEQLDTLQEQTTRDPLTGVGNRSHFDKTLAAITAQTAAGGASFSLIICDIDHFKRVNDVHGHPAGDEALINFASVLLSHSREGDLVARYGGEEFLLLAVDCDNATATRRAEAIRQALEQTPLPSLGGQAVTASFGVTEYQSGDAPETVLARADRALLKAKDNGRNRVIQLGAGNHGESAPVPVKRSWLSWLDSADQPDASEFDIVTPVPVELAIEKLRGFIADHAAEIISVQENQVSLKLNVVCSQGGRRRVDEQIGLRAQLTLSEARGDGDGPRRISATNVHVHLQPIRNRDRRSRQLNAGFAQVVASLRSYLMGELQPTDLG